MKFIYSLFCLLALLSCNQKTGTIEPEIIADSTISNDSTTVVNDSSSIRLFKDDIHPVAYQGIFPCNGCEGIQQTILFNRDHTFAEEHVKLQKEPKPKKSYGNWVIKNNRIELTEENDREITFDLRGDTLYGVRIHDITIKDPQKYKLEKKKLGIENPVWVKKKSEGISFVATGNEPFWNLEIRNGKDLSFKLADWEAPVVAPLESFNKTVDSIVYNLQTRNKKWSVVIYSQFCSDGMSPLLYQYKVNILYNGVHYKGCGIMLDKN
jgi:uncharacterized membrane protein